MSNVVLEMSAYSNISYRREYETYIPVEEWAEMTREQREEIMQEALWEDIEIIPKDEETGEYLD